MTEVIGTGPRVPRAGIVGKRNGGGAIEMWRPREIAQGGALKLACHPDDVDLAIELGWRVGRTAPEEVK